MAATLVAATTPLGTFAQAPAQPLKVLFRQLKLFDGKTDTARSGIQVLVEGNTIASIDKSNSPPPTDATVIDCGDRLRMPDLIDAHWHTLFAAVPVQIATTGDPGSIFTAPTAEAERTLMRGFTTVRDLGGSVFTFEQAIDNGGIPERASSHRER